MSEKHFKQLLIELVKWNFADNMDEALEIAIEGGNQIGTEMAESTRKQKLLIWRK